jgi:putative nucleotidyltransferase with HDIG domain
MSTELEKFIMTVGDLPTMSIVATKVMQLVEDERATADELAKVVSSDPGVAARVLKISNSAFYSCQRQIQTLPSAIMLLGFNTLRSLVLASSVKDVFKPYGLLEKMLWEHSFGAALAARTIAEECRCVNGEEAFLAGLMHDIGKIILLNNDRERFQRLIERCYNDDLDFESAETTIYPFTHAEIGGYVLQKWNFPEVLVTAIIQHHRFDFDDKDDNYQRRITAVASLADLFCLKLGIGERTPREDLDIAGSPAVVILNLDEERIDRVLNTFAEAYEQNKTYFH